MSRGATTLLEVTRTLNKARVTFSSGDEAAPRRLPAYSKPVCVVIILPRTPTRHERKLFVTGPLLALASMLQAKLAGTGDGSFLAGALH